MRDHERNGSASTRSAGQAAVLALVTMLLLALADIARAQPADSGPHLMQTLSTAIADRVRPLPLAPGDRYAFRVAGASVTVTVHRHEREDARPVVVLRVTTAGTIRRLELRVSDDEERRLLRVSAIP